MTLWALYLVSFATLGVFLADGYSYYATPYTQRPRHEDYRNLRPAGNRGLWFGIAGTAAMILMHVYSWRKRSKRFNNFGALRHWLDLHIYLGIIGPVLIVFHTSFKVQGLVAVSFWSMVGVALSGILGRYIYQQIPRNLQGQQLGLGELQRLAEDTARRLRDELGLPDNAIERVNELVTIPPPANRGMIAVLGAMIREDLLLPLTSHRLKTAYARILDVTRQQVSKMAELSIAMTVLQRRIQFLDQMRRLFHYWHVVHKPFAVIMYLVMAVHIGGAVWTGYARLF